MKKILLMAFLLLCATASLAIAQDVTSGVAIDPDKLAALLVFVGGGIVTTITGLLKTALKATGTLAVVITGAVAVLATGVYFLFIDPMAPAWDWLSFALYSVVIFGQATGFFHFYNKKTQN